jgi:hypothetical protein
MSKKTNTKTKTITKTKKQTGSRLPPRPTLILDDTPTMYAALLREHMALLTKNEQ